MNTAYSHLKTVFPVVYVYSRNLFACVVFLFHFARSPMVTVYFKGCYFAIGGQVGIETFVGIKGGNVDVPKSENRRRTAKKTIFGSGEMPFGRFGTANDAVGCPRFGKHKVVVEYQSLSERKPVIAYGKRFQFAYIAHDKVEPVMIVSFGIIFPEKRFSGIFFSQQAELNFIAVRERVFQRRVEIFAAVFPVGISLQDAVGKFAVTGTLIERFVESELHFASTTLQHFIHRWSFFFHFTHEEKRQN